MGGRFGGVALLEEVVHILPEVPVGDHGIALLGRQLQLSIQLSNGFVNSALGVSVVNTQDLGNGEEEPVGGSYELRSVNGLERARERGPEVDPTLLCSRPLVDEGLEVWWDVRLIVDPYALNSIGDGSMGKRFDAAVGVRSDFARKVTGASGNWMS